MKFDPCAPGASTKEIIRLQKQYESEMFEQYMKTPLAQGLILKGHKYRQHLIAPFRVARADANFSSQAPTHEALNDAKWIAQYKKSSRASREKEVSGLLVKLAIAYGWPLWTF